MELLRDYTDRLEGRERAAGFVEYVRALLETNGEYGVRPILEHRLGGNHPFMRLYQKAAVPAMDTTSGLLRTGLADAWLEELARETVGGRLVDKLEAPFSLTVPAVTSGAAAGWVAEGHPAPATALALVGVTLPPLKMGRVLTVSRELVRAVTPKAVALLDRALRRAVQRAEDQTLLDAVAAVALERPAGLMAGIVASGHGLGDADDVRAVWDACRSGAPDRPVFVCSPKGAVVLASTEAPMFREVSPVGGRLMGVPQITSPAAAGNLILIDSSLLVWADGGIEVSTAGATALAMDDDPQGSPASGGGTVTSLWTSNSIGLKITRYLNFALGVADAIAFCALPTGSPY